MWIIPKNLSIYRSAQDTGALTSDLNELSQQLEPSVMWRSNLTQSKTWLQRLKRGTLMQPLYGRTLRPLIGDSLVEKWTCSVVASLASHLAAPEEEKEARTQDTCGHISKTESSDLESLPLFSWKMSRELSQVNSEGTNGVTPRERRFCFMSLENWKEWITKRRRAYSQRVKLAHRTNGKEFLYLLSEMSSNKAVIIMSMDLYNHLKQQNKEQLGPLQEERASAFGNRQESQKENWTTPFARNHKGVQNNHPMKLNPRWVETLMGLPIGWTMKSCMNPVIVEQTSLDYLETESYLTQQQEHLEPCGENWPTPPASQRGDTVAVYEKKSRKREAQGLQRFAPTLQVAVLLEHEQATTATGFINEKGAKDPVYEYETETED